MARNEEKQQGRLNRLWLQRNREEGRLKDVHENRPRLSALNSASSVKKWIPSIKNEIEYYLQQSQLTHYPERKIAEFQLHIEALEREYKSFISKLRVLDPSCKHKPWTPRPYCKRRADSQDPPCNAKNPRLCDPGDRSSEQSEGESDSTRTRTGSQKTSERQRPERRLETPFNPLDTGGSASDASEAVCAEQDRPLAFDRARLAVATAAFRGAPLRPEASRAQSLARALHSGLPNLNYASLRQTQSKHTRKDPESGGGRSEGSVGGLKSSIQESDCEEKVPQNWSSGTTEERRGHVLGLGCYSSSDESDT